MTSEKLDQAASELLHWLTQKGTDLVILHTNLPNPIWPFAGTAHMEQHTAKGMGEGWAREHFPGIQVKVVEG